MTRLSNHFTLEEATVSETAARNGISNAPNKFQLGNMLVAASKLELLRESLNKSIIVTSWLRTKELNALIPGSSNTSAHTLGWAIDCHVSGMTSLELCIYASKLLPEYDQIIHEYGSWMHISFDPKSRKQNLTIFKNTKGKKYITGLLTEQEYNNV